MEGKKSTKGKKPQTTSDSIDLYSLQEKYTSHSISYKYSTFDELVEQGEYNFFGIIYDASFPQEEQDLSKYTCILKLIDQTTNCLTHPKDFNDNIIYLIIKSNEREKKKRNVYLNLNKDNKDNQLKGWCLYHWNINNNEPYACSNKKYSFESQDKPNLEGFKNWVRTYIGIDKSLVYPMQIKLENRNSEGDDKDLMVHVVKKIEADNHLILFIQDETDGCELHTYKYYNFIQENDIIRIRSFKIFDNSNLIINEFGNILIVPDNSSCAKTVFNELAKKMKSIK